MDAPRGATSTKRSMTAAKVSYTKTKKARPYIYADGENTSDYVDTDYDSTDSDMVIPGNSKFNMEQYAKKQKKAKAKAAEEKKNANRELRWQNRASRRQTS